MAHVQCEYCGDLLNRTHVLRHMEKCRMINDKIVRLSNQEKEEWTNKMVEEFDRLKEEEELEMDIAKFEGDIP